MPLTLVWGTDFRFETTVLSTGGTYDELFGIDGGTVGVSWKSIKDMIAAAAKHGVSEDLWPVYPDCDVDENVPLHDARTKSAQLRVELEKLPAEVVARDYWLSFISRVLRGGHCFFVMA